MATSYQEPILVPFSQLGCQGRLVARNRPPWGTDTMEIGKPQVKTLFPTRKLLGNIHQHPAAHAADPTTRSRQLPELKTPFHLRVCFLGTQLKTLAELRRGPSSNQPCLHHGDWVSHLISLSLSFCISSERLGLHL